MSAVYISIVQGDLEYDINFTLKDANGDPVILTNATIVFQGQMVSDFAVQFSAAMAVLNAASGTCKYNVQSGNFPVVGTYQAQIVVNYPSGEKITFSGVTLVAEARVPQS